MPSKKQYDLVVDEGGDSRSPMHSDMAFQHGIHFQAKYVGSMDVPRPSSRVEIVAAMRRIRHEFKVKAIKKEKVAITVSVDGVSVSLQKKTRRKPKWSEEDGKLIVIQHPIYRIFYVSHDSQDLKIFSYIARDGSTNIFKCNVFKSYKKNQAMQIVRTIGQAFEVCHRVSLQAAGRNEEEEGSQKSCEEIDPTATAHDSSTLPASQVGIQGCLVDPGTNVGSADNNLIETKHQLSVVHLSQLKGAPCNDVTDMNQPTSTVHHLQLLRHQLELQIQQTQFAFAQIKLLKDKLAAETAARIEAQTRTVELMAQYDRVVQYSNMLINSLTQLEGNADAIRTPNVPNLRPTNQIFENMAQMITGTDNQCGPALSSYMSSLFTGNSGSLIDKYSQESPDSGHRDMSSDSLSFTNNGQSETWHTPTSNNIAMTPMMTCTAINDVTSRTSRLGLNLPLNSTLSAEDQNDKQLQSNSISNDTNGPFDVAKGISKESKDIVIDQDENDGSYVGPNPPRIDPPPKARRSSSRSSHVSPLAPINDEHVSRSNDWTKQQTTSNGSTEPDLSHCHHHKPAVSVVEKRYSWESYMLADHGGLSSALNSRVLQSGNADDSSDILNSFRCNGHAVENDNLKLDECQEDQNKATAAAPICNGNLIKLDNAAERLVISAP